MSQMATLLVAVALVAVCHRLIKSYPVVFYGLAAAVACFGVYFTYQPSPVEAVRAMACAIQKGHAGFAFLGIVMFAGVFGESSAPRRALQPIRGELSLIAVILMAAHFVPYVISYGNMLGMLGSLRPSIVAGLAVAVVVLVLFCVLAVTSVKRVKHAMNARRWKQVQALAYGFFALIFVHLLGYLIVPAKAGAPEALTTLGFYTLVFGAYAALRLRRWRLDRRSALAG